MNKTYVSIGAVCMGIDGSNLYAKAMQDYFEIRTEWVDMVEILRQRQWIDYKSNMDQNIGK